MADGNKFQGERLESKSALSRNNLLEHLARYDMLPGGDFKVLDVGCGAGHGTYRLADKYREAVGVDISPSAIEYARTNWSHPRAVFEVSSGQKLPFESSTFDVVACFEVFEHVEDWYGLLREIARVMKPGAVLYISTPNKALYSPGTRKPINPHHVFEMYIPEFKAAVQRVFQLIDFYGQRTPVYNDHWVWRVVNPILFGFKWVIPYGWNNSLKLRLINWIKPELESCDIVIKNDDMWVNNSRFVIAVCKKNN